MTIDQLIQIGFFGLVTVVAYSIKESLKELTVSVRELNEKMAVVISTLVVHGERLDRVEKKIFKED